MVFDNKILTGFSEWLSALAPFISLKEKKTSKNSWVIRTTEQHGNRYILFEVKIVESGRLEDLNLKLNSRLGRI